MLRVAVMKKVLIVDDDSQLRNVYGLWLSKAGFECVETSGGKRAHELVQKQTFDLVLLDVMMPEIDGFKLCRYIRQTDSNRDTPIVLLSSMSDDQEIEHGLKQGATDYLTKPISNHLLVTKINSLIKIFETMRNCSPLTGLPGNVSIKEYCEFLLNSHQSFSIVYMDLDNFKPFNDYYGYERGDEVLKAFAQTMKECKGDNKIFLGHIGGDDFIAVLEDDEEAESFGRNVYRAFTQKVKQFYDQEHLNAGYIESQSRKGEVSRFPLMKVSVGVTSTNNHPGATYHELTEFATECKSVAKKSSQTKIFVDQRTS